MWRERRAELLNERLRGAQRVDLADESFSLDLAGLALVTPPAPAEDPAPSTGAKRRKTNNDADKTASADRLSSGRRRSPRSAAKDPYDLPDSSKASDVQSNTDPSANATETQPDPVSSSSVRAPSTRQDIAESELDQLVEAPDDTMPSVAAPGTAASRSSHSFRRVEEIEESPANEPGSGSRRSAFGNNAAGSSLRLQNSLLTSDAVLPSSSPLEQKKRRRSTAPRRSDLNRSTREEIDELSPNRPAERSVIERGNTPQQAAAKSTPAKPPSSDQPDPEEEPEKSQDEAEEIGDEEATRAIGLRPVQRSPQAGSPELGSSVLEIEGNEDEERQSKRRRRQPPPSPAAQKQPRTKAKKPSVKHKDKATSGAKKQEKPRQHDGDTENATIEITVQRFINNKKTGGEEESAEGVQSEIPFANRSGESVVDVFAQVCEEVTATVLAQIQEVAEKATDAAKKKEYRVKMRASLHLNHWHSLRKRLRHAQKEKLTLREEILRLKAEREQVALQMDEIRIKHEVDTKEAKVETLWIIKRSVGSHRSQYRLDTSSLMHDIDLAVAQGQEAPELSRKDQKQAELANLELLVSRVVDEASSASSTGGLLNQVKDFNAFLERAAIALETK
ncbi:Protein MNN4 [Paramyrothecium foliicola]|nr:Protein MNN4 [Paramyrothecium foliicola]